MTLNVPDLADAVTPETSTSATAADPCTIVIFGASGDLTRRKLIPALYELASQKSFGAALCHHWLCAQPDDRRGFPGRRR